MSFNNQILPVSASQANSEIQRREVSQDGASAGRLQGRRASIPNEIDRPAIEDMFRVQALMQAYTQSVEDNMTHVFGGAHKFPKG